MEVKVLINIRKYVCYDCAYYLHQEDGYAECRFPKDKKRLCSVDDIEHKWLAYKVYQNRWKDETNLKNNP